MWGRISRVRFKVVVISAILIWSGSTIMVKTVREWQTWDELQRTQVRTEAKILNRQVSVDQSGKVKNYHISYEFTAPGEGGSSTSSSELQKKLEEKFFRGSDYRLDPSEIPKPRNDGQRYFSRTQVVEPSFQISSDSSTIAIIYAANNPQNTLIAGTGRYPIPEAIMIVALLALGGSLGYLGISPCFQSNKIETK